MRPFLASPHDLKPNPWNTNNVDPDGMEKLKRSITELGFASAVVVREVDGEYQILGGQHRTEAAIELGLEQIPVLSLGEIEEDRAKKIGLVDNSRYGADDAYALAELFEDLNLSRSDIAAILPMDENEIDQVFNIVDVNLDELDMLPDDDDEQDDDGITPVERTPPTHTTMRFRLTNADAEAVSRLIEKTISRESIKDGDDATNAGSALAHLLLNN